VRRVVDLLLHLPRRWEDRGRVVGVAEALAGPPGPVLVRGVLSSISARHVRRRLHLTDAVLDDGAGRLAVRWFNQRWIADRLRPGAEVVAAGVLGLGPGGRRQLVNPELVATDDPGSVEAIVPVYPPLGPLAGKRLRRVMRAACAALEGLTDPLPAPVRAELALPGLAAALEALHRPPAAPSADERAAAVAGLGAGSSPAHRRFAFDELLAMASVTAADRARRRGQRAAPIAPSPAYRRAAATLFGFALTAAQRRAVDEILADLGQPTPMARLLQGDVGSGKTAVAILALLAAVSGGRQAALMAPTELLAEQLHRSVAGALEPLGHRVGLLTGSLGAAEAKALRGAVASGEIGVLVGTHALFQDRVRYADLGLVVIDEQHRFGVAQRRSLLGKGTSPHLLVMTATPIPRSLALTVYGDLDLTIVDELPPGRLPVRTEVRDPSARERILAFLRSEVASGGQGFVVCPVIDPSPAIEAVSLAEHERTLRAALPGVAIGLLHGRLDRSERDAVAERFRRGELGVILATTVVEVGVDVPAASVMIVEGADRFGLSQLHQLRGRVGRGTRPSWCILVTGDEPSEAARRRLEVLVKSSDGFEIAEADLRHRGPGELTGLRQWGLSGLRFADLGRDADLIRHARDVARRLAAEGELDGVRRALLELYPIGEGWSGG
jgi:ATP-dependent DNA helicase RecG